MKTEHLPYLSVTMGLFLLMLINGGSVTDSNGETMLPLLTLLIVNEFAFFLSIAGAFTGIRQLKIQKKKFDFRSFYSLSIVICCLLTIQFALLGIKLWPL